MLLSVPNMVPLEVIILGNLGIGLAAASAAVVNHVVDQRVDAIMTRTKNRPLPQGNVTMGRALVFAAVLCILSMGILVAFINNLTAVLTLGSLIGYGFVYSMYLKRATPAKHSNRWCFWRRATGARLDRSDGNAGSSFAFIISDYFCLDPSAFLGAGYLPS